MSDVIAAAGDEGGPAYYAKGCKVFKNAVARRTDSGTNYTLGFPVCQVSDWLDEEGATTIAKMLCVAEAQP